jgi:hypothetical protein
MFRPIRTLLMIVVAFYAGKVFEASAYADLCESRGGAMSEGLCLGVDE